MRAPNTRKQLRGFLEMAGYCCIWKSKFGLIAKPLYEALKGPKHSPSEWAKDCSQAVSPWRHTWLLQLPSTPALGLPDLLKPFPLYVQERQGFALGVLTQMLSDILQPITYLSEKLITPSRDGQPAWELWQPSASFSGSCKVFLGAAYHHLCTPPSAEPARGKRKCVAHRWKNGQVPSNSSRQSQCLPENCKLNPASLLEPGWAMLMYDCAEIIDVYSSKTDLQDHHLEEADGSKETEMLDMQLWLLKE